MRQKNLSLNDWAAEMIEDLADDEGVTQAEIVQRAVKQYNTESWEGMVERKLNRIEEATVGDVSGDASDVRSESSENTSSADGSTDEGSSPSLEPPERIGLETPVERLPVELSGSGYSVVEKQNAVIVAVTAEHDYITAEDIENTLNELWHEGVNGASPQTVDRYVENIGERFSEELDGWEKIPGKKAWEYDPDDTGEIAEESLNDVLQEYGQLSPDDDPEEISGMRKRLAEAGNFAIRNGVWSREEMAERIEALNELEEEARKRSQSDGRRGKEQRKKSEMKNSALR